MHVRVTTEANYKAWWSSRVSGLAAQPLAEAECEPVEQLEPGDEAEAEEEAEQATAVRHQRHEGERLHLPHHLDQTWGRCATMFRMESTHCCSGLLTV